jgi:ubiquinone/menaquinone biosynthesis C-methylase UbiE
MSTSDVNLQRAYYAETAEKYDTLHTHEHSLGLGFMISALELLGIRSILDIGCGTGRALLKVKEKMPGISMVGIEPSPELRSVGHTKGLSETELIDGDGLNLAFADGSFDVVCEFGVLHHVPQPSRVVSEMLRVARKAIFISDSNNFGQGGAVSRLMKQSFNSVGLWPLVNRIRTKGQGYMISEGDGVFYSYSVFNDYKQIAEKCKSIHVVNTNDSGLTGPNLYRTASHVALLGIKR